MSKAIIVKDGAEMLQQHQAGQEAKRSEEAQACIKRFQTFHQVVKGNVTALMLAKFLAGLEVQTLCDLHDELYGETRGRKADEEISDTLSFLTQGDFLEEALGVTKRTAYRYRAHFESVTQCAPEAAEKLRKWWLGWKEKAVLELPAEADGQIVTTGPQTLALHEVCNLASKDIEELLNHPDAWGLNEMFEKPLKDVTPPEESAEPANAPDAKERLAKFWLKDVSRRLLNNEFLKLRKQDREALLPAMEEALNKLKDSLKGGKKG